MLRAVLSMGKQRGRHAGDADGEGYRRVRGRSLSRARTRSASGARDKSKPRVADDNNTFDHKWTCWGTFAGKRCGRQCVGIKNCARCGRSAPDKAWNRCRDSTGRRPRSPPLARKVGIDDSSSEVAKLRREVAQAKADSAKRDREMRELRAALEARTEGPAAAPDDGGGDGKEELRKDIEALQREIRNIEALGLPDLAGEVDKRKLKLAALVEQRVQGQPVPQRLRNIEATILKKDKQLEALGGDMADLDEERIRLGAEMEKKRVKYAEHEEQIKTLQLERARLLDQQAAEARCTVPAAAPAAPAPEAPARPTFEQAWAVLKGVHDECSTTDEERAIVASIGQRVAQLHQQQQQQQEQQLAAAAASGRIPVPTSPRGERAALVGEAAADGRSEHGSEGGGTAPDVAATPALAAPAATQADEVPASIPAAQPDPATQDVVMAATAATGSVLDRVPLSAAQAMEAAKRRRLQK